MNCTANITALFHALFSDVTAHYGRRLPSSRAHIKMVLKRHRVSPVAIRQTDIDYINRMAQKSKQQNRRLLKTRR